MAPPLPLSTMEVLPRSICRSCRTRLSFSTPSSTTLTTRTFTTTPTRHAIPPESPHFVDVPRPFQPDWTPPTPQKGYHPKPKDIFPRTALHKTTPAFALACTRQRKDPIDPESPHLTPSQRYKLSMSALRQSHLRSSLSELLHRRTTHVSRLQNRSARKSSDSRRLVTQPTREDERLTNISIPSSMNPELPNRFNSATEALALHARKTANIAAHIAVKQAEKMDSLHTLYMSARGFITDEKQLLEKVREEFEENSFGGTVGMPNKSLWDKYGAPDGVRQMVDASGVGGRRDGKGRAGDGTRYKRDQERMKRIAEKLSGGKL